MLGDDDWFEPDFMEQSYYYINKFNLDIFSGWVNAYDQDHHFIEIVTSSSFINSLRSPHQEENLVLFDGIQYINAFITDFRSGFSKMHLSSTFMKRSLYSRVNGFNQNLKYCAESELYLKLSNEGAKFGFLQKSPLVNYIGYGPQRRAIYLNPEKKYHDFLKIPDIMRSDNMISERIYNQFIGYVLSILIHQGNLSFPSGIKVIYTSSISYKFIWIILFLITKTWNVSKRLIDKLFTNFTNYLLAK